MDIEEQKRWAWHNARPHPSGHPLLRYDPEQDLTLAWWAHGTRGQFGWHVDHWPLPKAADGPDAWWNLRARHWRTNLSHGGLLGAALRGLGATDRSPTLSDAIAGSVGVLRHPLLGPQKPQATGILGALRRGPGLLG